jgi:hypothetical protein
MGTDGACGLLFCAAKRSGAFPPNMPAVLFKNNNPNAYVYIQAMRCFVLCTASLFL